MIIDKPKVRLPGAGGAPEIAGFCRRTLVLLRQNPKSFVDTLDFMTTVGMFHGGRSRLELGLPGRGPEAVITDLGILEPDASSGELVLTHLHPGVSAETAVAATGWLLEVADTARHDRGADRARARNPPRAGAVRGVEFRGLDPGLRERRGRDTAMTGSVPMEFKMTEALICDAIRTPVGRYGGALATVRTDDLAAIPLRALLQRNPGLDPAAVDDVILGCANQAGEDNRNVARMALLLAGLPAEVTGDHGEPAVRLRDGCHRHCGSRHQGG